MLRTSIVLAALAMAGCGTAYSYVPATTVASARGTRFASYAITDGTVRIASLGVTKVHAREAPESRVPALHLRLEVENEDEGEGPVRVDTRSVVVVLPGEAEARPSFVDARDVASLPWVTIAPGERRALDLYYRLPARFAEAKELPSFAVQWSVRTDRTVYAERTPFDRIVTPPPSKVAYGELGPWGPGPFWAAPTIGGGASGPPLLTRDPPDEARHRCP
jgi:hypothetical protein